MEKQPRNGAASQNRPAKHSGGSEPARVVLLSFVAGALFLVLVATVWFAAGVLVLVFASILLAVLLHDACNQLRRFVPMSNQVALAAVVVLALGILAAGGWLLAPSVSAQVEQLAAQIPASLQSLQTWLEQFPAAQRMMRALPGPGSLLDNVDMLLGRAQFIFSNVLGIATNAAVVAFVALYLAAQPEAYTGGFLRLVPPGRRGRAGEVMGQIGNALTHWLRGKLLTMLVVGILTATGLELMGLPLALTLGIIAGLLDFIPYIGPILAGIPAGLIAFTTDPVLTGYVALLFFVVQSIEGYLLMPLVERNTVALPPALTITMQVLMGLAFGLPGVALATPFAATLAVAIKMLYVEDVLGER
jgi:predicted PurR-regulated permease PerM